jgi:hypothetical protein
MMPKRLGKNTAPLIIHSVNVSALLLGGVILLLTAVSRSYQLIILLPVLGLLVVYWRFRMNPPVVAWYFGMAMALLGWILICEHIVTIDNVLGTQISRRLSLGLRLQSYVLATFQTPDRMYLEPCCHDSLTWRYRPGSRHRSTFDCPTCNEPYEILVDETGYLNRQRDLMQRHQQIDLFLAGDSVLQGFGVPSVLESIRTQIPLRMWNLSIAGYGPRPKINALITYALPKRPQWLIVEFYAGNDLADAILDDACNSLGDFRCRLNGVEIRRRLAQHPVYHTIFDLPSDVFARFADATAENLTLATTRFLMDAMKAALQERLRAGSLPPSPSHGAVDEFHNTMIGTPAWSPVAVRESQWLAYLKVGMGLVQQQYERLWATLEGIDPKPTVILLYNPSPYEIYGGMWVDPIPEADKTSAFQRAELSAFARTHGWRFLDLTEPLRQEVRARQAWLYGRYDKSHWSPQGTALVADVLGPELQKIITPRKGSS